MGCTQRRTAVAAAAAAITNRIVKWETTTGRADIKSHATYADKSPGRVTKLAWEVEELSTAFEKVGFGKNRRPSLCQVA